MWTIHRQEDIWGPDGSHAPPLFQKETGITTAEVFDPDRFLDECLGKYLTPNPYIFTPFNAGPRICLGQQFAHHETSFFLIRLLQHFSKLALDLHAQPVEIHAPESWAECEGTKGREKFKIRPVANLALSVKKAHHLCINVVL